MKTTAASTATARALRATFATTLALAAFSSFTWAQAVVDPDPDIFDGTKSKRAGAISQEKGSETAVDDWEGGNMVIYDTNGKAAEQGDGQGGSGEGGGEGPGGLQVSIPLPGLPIPLGGGGGIPGAEGGIPPLLPLPGAQPPGGIPQNGGMPPGGMPSAGMPPGGMSGDTTGAAQSSARPSSVSIGDPSQRIKTTAQGQAGNTAGPADAGEPGGTEAGEDSTQMPAGTGSGSGQTGNRGGGVEKGDAMPPDQI